MGIVEISEVAVYEPVAWARFLSLLMFRNSEYELLYFCSQSVPGQMLGIKGDGMWGDCDHAGY